MKIRERSAVGGAGRQAGPSPMGGQVGPERLPLSTRERKPALAALAVLLILVGALGATVMVMRAGNKISVIQITQPVAAGDRIPDTAIREVMVSDGSGVHFVLWKQRHDLQNNYRAATTYLPGTVLVKEMLTKKGDVLTDGQAIVGLSLKEGQFPTGLKIGDTVAAYHVGNDAAKAREGTSGSPASTRISGHLIVKSVSSDSNGISGGDLSVTVVVDTLEVDALTIAADASEVTLVLVPDSKN